MGKILNRSKASINPHPKQPTISVYCLVEGEYQVNQFRGVDRIESPALPELNLTAQQVFQAGDRSGVGSPLGGEG